MGIANAFTLVNQVNIDATTASQAVLLPTLQSATLIIVQNNGQQNVYVATGTSSAVAATTGSTLVSPGEELHLPLVVSTVTQTWIALISALGASSVEISVAV
jgi:hypothetical protein